MNTQKILALITGLTLSVAANAGNLVAPFSLSSAKVLPKGVRNLSYKHIAASVTEGFGSGGQTISAADPLYRSIKLGDIITYKKSPQDQAKVEQAMDALGLTEEDTVGNTTGQVNVKATVHVPILAWGLTNKLTVAVAVPILESSINVDTGVQKDANGNYDAFIAKLNEKGAPSSVAKLSDPVPAKADEYGYKAIQNENKDKLGDIKLVAKYNVFQQAAHMFTLQGAVTLPTGQDQDMTELVDVASGDDQTDVGVGFLYDYSINDKVTIASGLSYTWQLPDKNMERIWERYDAAATPDIDNNTDRDLGDIVAINTGVAFSDRGWSTGFGYTFQYKEGDRYAGTAFDSYRYDWLEQRTEQNMHTAQMFVGYDTLYAFKQKKFPVPLSLKINHTRVIAGKNVASDPATTLDFGMFF